MSHLLRLQAPRSPVPGVNQAPLGRFVSNLPPDQAAGRRQVGFRGDGEQSHHRTGRTGGGRGWGEDAPARPWDDPSRAPDIRAHSRQPRSPCAAERPGRTRGLWSRTPAELDLCAYRRENNDRTGSASGWASGSPSPQAGLSRNLGGVFLSMGVQCRSGPGTCAKALRSVRMDFGPEHHGGGYPQAGRGS